MSIMPRGEALLLPASPLFIAFTLLLALCINMLPWDPSAARPDVLVVVLAFWVMHQPRRIGVGIAFLFGLAMDVHQGALLGQHSLAYTLIWRGGAAPPLAVVSAAAANCAGGAAVCAVALGAGDRAAGRGRWLFRLGCAVGALARRLVVAAGQHLVARPPAQGARPGSKSAAVNIPANHARPG
jgi:hypothetical protein